MNRDVWTEDARISGDHNGAADHQASPWCSNQESEVFRMQEHSTRRRQGAENIGFRVRTASRCGTSGDAKS